MRIFWDDCSCTTSHLIDLGSAAEAAVSIGQDTIAYSPSSLMNKTGHDVTLRKYHQCTMD